MKNEVKSALGTEVYNHLYLALSLALYQRVALSQLQYEQAYVTEQQTHPAIENINIKAINRTELNQNALKSSNLLLPADLKSSC